MVKFRQALTGEDRALLDEKWCWISPRERETIYGLAEYGTSERARERGRGERERINAPQTNDNFQKILPQPVHLKRMRPSVAPN